MRALVLLLTGCWTGSDAPPTPPDDNPSAFEIRLERTQCLGPCPAYKVSLDGDGRVRWRGEANVGAMGQRRATVPPRRIREIERKLVEVRFFERDVDGRLPRPPECVRSGKTSSCSFHSVTICSDTSRSIISVRRGTKRHEIMNDHCSESPLDSLEDMIDDIARTSGWIGPQITNPSPL